MYVFDVFFSFYPSHNSGQIFGDVIRLQVHRNIERNATQRRRIAGRHSQADPFENTENRATDAVAFVVTQFYVHLFIVQEFVP